MKHEPLQRHSTLGTHAEAAARHDLMLEMHEGHGLSPNRIASELGVRPATVRRGIQKARERKGRPRTEIVRSREILCWSFWAMNLDVPEIAARTGMDPDFVRAAIRQGRARWEETLSAENRICRARLGKAEMDESERAKRAAEERASARRETHARVLECLSTQWKFSSEIARGAGITTNAAATALSELHREDRVQRRPTRRSFEYRLPQ